MTQTRGSRSISSSTASRSASHIMSVRLPDAATTAPRGETAARQEGGRRAFRLAAGSERRQQRAHEQAPPADARPIKLHSGRTVAHADAARGRGEAARARNAGRSAGERHRVFFCCAALVCVLSGGAAGRSVLGRVLSSNLGQLRDWRQGSPGFAASRLSARWRARPELARFVGVHFSATSRARECHKCHTT